MGKQKTEEKQKAYDLYCNTGLLIKEIAAVVHVTPAQVGKWVKDGNWEMYREAQQVTIEKLIHGYYQQLSAINKDVVENHNGIPTPSHTDSQVKITNAIDSLRKKYNLSSYHAVLREYLEYEMKADAEKAKLFGPRMLDFLKYKAKQLQNDKNS
jgi:hypothetical protein